MALAQKLLRSFSGLIIEIPLSWEDDLTSTHSAFDKDSVTEDDNSTGCSTSCFGVRFHEQDNVYQDLPKNFESLEPEEVWFSPNEIALFQEQANLSTQNLLKDSESATLCLNVMQRAYKTAYKATSETNTSPMSCEERSSLETVYRNHGDNLLGLEREILPSFKCDSQLRQMSILRVLQQIQNRPVNKTSAGLLQQENALRLASQTISRPARMLARDLARVQAQVLHDQQE